MGSDQGSQRELGPSYNKQNNSTNMRTSIANEPSHVCNLLFALTPADLNQGTGKGTTSQVIDLTILQPGDMVLSQGVRIDLQTPATHEHGISVALGLDNDAVRFVGLTDIKSPTLKALRASDATKLIPYVNNTGSQRTLKLTVQASGGTLETMQVGQVWVVVPVLRYTDRFTDRLHD